MFQSVHRRAWRRVMPRAGALALTLVGGLAPTADADDIRSRQWYLDAMRADDLWEVSTGKGVTVAVVDTGVNPDAAEIRGRVLKGKDFYSPNPDPWNDTDGHGTNMAITIAGRSSQGGLKGLAPDVKILPVKALKEEASFGALEAAAKGIRYAADTDAQIINASLGSAPSAKAQKAVDSAVKYALKKGKLVFAATGNDGQAGVEYPAAAPGVIAVGSVGSTGKISKFSDYGEQVALAAPGEDIPVHCTQTEGYCRGDGTSASTALASASAALIWSKHPDWTNNQVLRVMMQTAGHNGPVPSDYIGYGIVRPAKVLLEGKGDPGDPDVNPLLAARQKESPAPSTSPSPANKGDSKKNKDDDQSQPRQQNAAAESDGGGTLWIVAGGVAAAVAVVGAALAVRARKRRAA
ncbi:type VII secretion-associated serine protease mycosin [Streptomyces sp. B-S-A8]|uniref:Type VII secretion-associated serine protease mycosin n=1 Tax=Streptomyces solicavernae TaxID=3043614 RepID=A0ABT6S142_9ACTN|nr:type VII secretion-associated serine protease mycosin [Streptomyces sp. B-S-A8]MDI3390408.1 type VII secretion-associated serine protease mycosin [Streptomyces sp. B-S-A8]